VTSSITSTTTVATTTTITTTTTTTPIPTTTSTASPTTVTIQETTSVTPAVIFTDKHSLTLAIGLGIGLGVGILIIIIMVIGLVYCRKSRNFCFSRSAAPTALPDPRYLDSSITSAQRIARNSDVTTGKVAPTQTNTSLADPVHNEHLPVCMSYYE